MDRNTGGAQASTWVGCRDTEIPKVAQASTWAGCRDTEIPKIQMLKRKVAQTQIQTRRAPTTHELECQHILQTLNAATTKMQRLLNILVTEFSDSNDLINDIQGISVLVHRKMFGFDLAEDGPDMD